METRGRGAPKKYYTDRLMIRFELDVNIIGQMDKLALNDNVSRTEILTKAVMQYIKRRAK